MTISIYPFVKTDSGLSAYYHGNADFPNVWERCWPTRAIPVYKGAIADKYLDICNPIRVRYLVYALYNI